MSMSSECDRRNLCIAVCYIHKIINVHTIQHNSCDEADICKSQKLACRAGDACEIHCSGRASCSDGTIIDATTATDVTINCLATDSCKTDIKIKCGTGHCNLNCNDPKACIDWGFIDYSTSSSFQCTGHCTDEHIPKFIPNPTTSPRMINANNLSTYKRNMTHNHQKQPVHRQPFHQHRRHLIHRQQIQHIHRQFIRLFRHWHHRKFRP